MRSTEHDKGINQPITLETAGWAIPVVRPSFIFQIAQAETTAPPEKQANLHIGTPPSSEALRNMQRQALWEGDFPAIDGLSEPGQRVVITTTNWLNNSVIPNMSRYGPSGGRIETRERIIRKFGNNFNIDQTTIVSGGANVAIDLIDRILKHSMSDDSARLTTIHIYYEDDLKYTKERIQAARSKGNYIHLVVNQAVINERLKAALRGHLTQGRTVLTEMVTDSFNQEHSLALDETVKDAVFTVDDTPLTRQTAISSVHGNRQFVKSIQGLHTRLAGSPSSTQEDLYALLYNEQFVQDLQRLTAEDFEEIGKNPFLHHLLIYLQTSISEHHRLNALYINQEKAELAQKLKEFYFPSLSETQETQSNVQARVLNGGGREGLVLAFEHLYKQGIRRVVIAEPFWTYDNVVPEDMEIIALKNCYDRQGNLNTSNVSRQLAELTNDGETSDIAMIIESGGRNPNGAVHSLQTKIQILSVCAYLNVPIIDDAAYHHMVFGQDNDNLSFAEIASILIKNKALPSRYENQITTVFSFSKAPAMAGARLNAILTSNQDLLQDIEVRDINEEANVIAVLVAKQLFEDKKSMLKRERELNRDVAERVKAACTVLDDFDIRYQIPKGAFYIVVKDVFPGPDPFEQAFILAKEGIRTIPMALFEEGSPDTRITVGGDRTPEEVAHQVRLLAEKIKPLTAILYNMQEQANKDLDHMAAIFLSHWLGAAKQSGILEDEDEPGFSHLYAGPGLKDDGRTLLYPTQLALIKTLGEQRLIDSVTTNITTDLIEALLENRSDEDGDLEGIQERIFLKWRRKPDGHLMTKDDKTRILKDLEQIAKARKQAIKFAKDFLRKRRDADVPTEYYTKVRKQILGDFASYLGRGVFLVGIKNWLK